MQCTFLLCLFGHREKHGNENSKSDARMPLPRHMRGIIDWLANCRTWENDYEQELIKHSSTDDSPPAPVSLFADGNQKQTS